MINLMRRPNDKEDTPHDVKSGSRESQTQLMGQHFAGPCFISYGSHFVVPL